MAVAPPEKSGDEESCNMLRPRQAYCGLKTAMPPPGSLIPGDYGGPRVAPLPWSQWGVWKTATDAPLRDWLSVDRQTCNKTLTLDKTLTPSFLRGWSRVSLHFGVTLHSDFANSAK